MQRQTSKEAWTEKSLLELFPAVCGVASQALTAIISHPPEEEAAAIKGSATARKLEFSAGRSAARKALKQVGLQNAIIPAHSNRSPIWPSGYIGSIAHAGKIAVAAAARTKDINAIGVDIELAEAVTEALWPDVMLPVETELVGRLPDPVRRKYATVIFSAKEAFYKFQFPHTQTWLEFHDVAVSLDLTLQTFSVRPASALNIGGYKSAIYNGAFRTSDFFVMTALFVRPPLPRIQT